MTPDRLEALLERVERGETTSMDAAWLREHLALQEIQRVVADAGTPDHIQIAVGSWLRDHGVHDGWNDAQYAARMAAWAQVELTDLLQLFHMPQHLGAGLFGSAVYSMMGATEMAAALSSMLLANLGAWDDCSPDLELPPDQFETRLVELAMPILALADAMQIDLIEATRRKLTVTAATGWRD